MNSYSSENFICPTPLLIFYKNEGAVITYKWVIAYERGKPFKEFIDSQTAARIQSDIENKPGKAKLHKDLSNSCYGAGFKITTKIVSYKSCTIFVVILNPAFDGLV